MLPVVIMRDDEAFLLKFLDEQIVIAEERELLAHYHRCIAREERRTCSVDSADGEVRLENQRGTILNEDGGRPKFHIDTAPMVCGLEYLQVTKILPRSFLARRDGSTFPIVVFVDAILAMFRSDAQNLLAHSIHWKGFHIQLQSADPSSWRMTARGYRHTINLLLVSLRRRLETQSFRVEGLEERKGRPLRFVKAYKVIPRFLFTGEVHQRTAIVDRIVTSFRQDCQQLLDPGDWMGFRVRLISFNPTSFRLEVTGFQHIVNLLMQYFGQECTRLNTTRCP